MQDGLKLNRVCYKHENTFLSIYFHLYQEFCWPGYVTQEHDFFSHLFSEHNYADKSFKQALFFVCFRWKIKQLS